MKCTMYHSCAPGHVVQERVLYRTLPCVLRTRRRNRNRCISFVCVWMCVYFLNKMTHHLKKVKCQFLTLASHENHLRLVKNTDAWISLFSIPLPNYELISWMQGLSISIFQKLPRLKIIATGEGGNQAEATRGEVRLLWLWNHVNILHTYKIKPEKQSPKYKTNYLSTELGEAHEELF